MKTRIITDEQFNNEKQRHLANLEDIRAFIIGDEYNEPQVTYVPNAMKFIKLYEEVKEWIQTSYNDNSEE